MPSFDGRGPRGFGPERGLGPCGQGARRGRGGFFGNRSGFSNNQTGNNPQNIDNINIDKQEQKRILKAEIQELEAEKKYLAKQIENLEKN